MLNSEQVRFLNVKWLCLAVLLVLVSLVTFQRSAKAAGPYEVGAFYFDNWNPQLNPSAISNYKKIYGSSANQWSGVTDMLTVPGLWGFGPLPNREPLQGWYDDRNQSVVDQQILQAASRGLDHFAFYYYWSEAGGGERPGQQSIYNFINSPYKDLMKFYMYFIADGQWPASDWNTYMVPKLVSMMQDPSYKKTPDGRPIVGFYGNFAARLGGATQWQTALQSLRTAAQNAGLPNPLLLDAAYRTLQPSITAGMDGFLPLNLAGIGLDSHQYVPEDYATSYPPAWNDFVYATYPPGSGYENYENYLLIPGGISGYDPRPWGKGHDNYVYADPSPLKFRAQLTNIKNYLDSHPGSMNISTIYAWNENAEGGVIEPTTLHGFGNLNAIQEVFGLSNSAYKAKVSSLGLTDLDPNLRIEIAPEYDTVTDGQTVKIKGKVTNHYASSITSGSLTLNTGGWSIASSTGTNLTGLAANASQNFEFQVTVGAETKWIKHGLTATAAFVVGGTNQNISESTFVVKAEKVNGVIEPIDQAVFGGDTFNLIADLRNYSLTAQSGSYSIQAPAGWYVSGNGESTYSLSAYTGGVHTNRKTSKTFQVTVPDDTPAGVYTLRIRYATDGGTSESSTTVRVGNYLSNGSFELNSNDPLKPDAWPTSGSMTLSLSTDAVDGTKSAKLVSTGYGANIHQEWFKPDPTKSYLVEAWVKVTSGKLRISEDEADASFGFLGTNAYVDASGSTWTKYSFKFKPRPNAANMSIRLTAWDTGTTTAYVDKVVFKPDPDGTMLQNSSVELDADANGLADQWVKYGTPTLTIDSTTFADGAKSQRIVGTGYSQGIAQEWLSVDPNQNYAVEFWAKVDSGALAVIDGEAKSDSTWIGENTTYQITAAANGGVWKKYSYEFTPNTAAAKTSLRLFTWASGASDIHVDGITLKKAPVNLARNYDFESNTVVSGVPDRWLSMGSPTLSRVTDAANGAYSTRIVATGYSNGIKQEWIDMTDTEPYLIEAWVKVASGALAIQDGEATGSFAWLGENLNAVATNGAWTKYSYVVTPKPGARRMSIRFVSWSSGSTDALVDHVVVRPARGANLLVNPGFEQDVNADGTADVWTKSGTATLTRSTDKAAGTYSQEIASTGTGNGLQQQWMNVSPNTTYQLTVNTKVTAGSLNVAVGEATSASALISQTTVETIAVSGWQTKTYSITTGATTAQLSIRFLGGAAGSNDALVDEVNLQKKE
ncbi:carbohydrate binding domain-containing protein [Paenibacillus oryzisoli]|uniref:carbohydrate binding domain-containing protein n=1 Tax=Paenibacillus oryzisoli TaxID=1850517 RepID=UPI003D2CFAAC